MVVLVRAISLSGTSVHEVFSGYDIIIGVITRIWTRTGCKVWTKDLLWSICESFTIFLNQAIGLIISKLNVCASGYHLFMNINF